MDSEYMLCPYCGEEIKKIAKKCKHCGEWLVGEHGGGGAGGSSADQLTQARQALASRYEVRREIGRGGMATVYEAVQKSLDRTVALKVLPSQFTHDEEFTERFHREARSAAALNHPNIITIYDEGVESGVHYMAMEYIEGEDLHDMIGRQGPLSLEQIRRYIQPIAEGLEYAHRQGMVHRDIKSANILISADGRPVLTDFGIARAAEGTKLTQTGMVIGTPEYMSPEHARGDHLDSRADLYSLGVIVYEAVTGDLPFHADTPLGLIHKITTEEAPRPEAVRAGVEPWLAEVIMKALEKDPERRFASGAEFAEALEKGVSETVGQKISYAFSSTEEEDHKPGKTKKLVSSENARQGARNGRAGNRNENDDTTNRQAESEKEEVAETSGGWNSGQVGRQEQQRKKKRLNIILFTVVLMVVMFAGFRYWFATGTLVVSSVPEGAEVVIDGLQVGSTPKKIDQVSPRSYTLRLSHEGYEPVKRKVRIQRYSTSRVDVKLKPRADANEKKKAQDSHIYSIVNFTSQDADNRVVDQICKDFEYYLITNTDVLIVERSRLVHFMQQQGLELQIEDITLADKSKISELGKLVSPDRFLFGHISKNADDDNFILEITIVDSKAAEIIISKRIVGPDIHGFFDGDHELQLSAIFGTK